MCRPFPAWIWNTRVFASFILQLISKKPKFWTISKQTWNMTLNIPSKKCLKYNVFIIFTIRSKRDSKYTMEAISKSFGFCYLAVENIGVSCVEVSRHLPHIQVYARHQPFYTMWVCLGLFNSAGCYIRCTQEQWEGGQKRFRPHFMMKIGRDSQGHLYFRSNEEKPGLLILLSLSLRCHHRV